MGGWKKTEGRKRMKERTGERLKRKEKVEKGKDEGGGGVRVSLTRWSGHIGRYPPNEPPPLPSY